jgi:hypothetical protein
MRTKESLMAPDYLKTCIRVSMPARDWHKLDDCVDERYDRIASGPEGITKADKWARREAVWFIVTGLKSLVDPRTWF